jgi:hypothetical protein
VAGEPAADGRRLGDVAAQFALGDGVTKGLAEDRVEVADAARTEAASTVEAAHPVQLGVDGRQPVGRELVEPDVPKLGDEMLAYVALIGLVRGGPQAGTDRRKPLQ